MAITCRLREYKAEEENRYEHLLRHSALTSAILIVGLTVYLGYCFFGSGQQKAVVEEKVLAAPIGAGPGSGHFAAANWWSLPDIPGPGTPAEPGVQDPGAPEWAGRLAFKDLKAMAVYEVRDTDGGGEESRRMADVLEKGGAR